ncbi:hypothetical protein Q4490_04410 [Neptunomonas phycophila]|uniref:Uncharacterized protein n=1 Tax=Neptunomonas phycophila TaxID=1572645 RepID=A0AAW7XF86_9GAMM|nr:hypothetical protein [Neptunomonas phycophila]MDO6452800.1 hypothetical protein [Neptunomonas phycophila]
MLAVLLSHKRFSVGLIEAILLGIQFKKLQKPIVFFAMLVGLILFSVLGLGIIGALISSIVNTEKEFTLQLVGASFGLLAISFIFFALASACGYFIKRCFG